MNIISYWPAPEGGRTKAHFDIEIMEGLRICGLKLVVNEQGQYRTIAPQLGTRRTVTMLPEVATQITGAAVARMKGLQPNDRN